MSSLRAIATIATHVFRRHQAHIVPQGGQLPTQVMRTAAGFHRHYTLRPLLSEFRDRFPLQPTAQH